MNVTTAPTPRERAEAAMKDMKQYLDAALTPAQIEELTRKLTGRFIDTESCIRLKLRK